LLIYVHYICDRLESEIVEEIAMDVLGKLNRVYVGDLDQQIKKYEQLAEYQRQYFEYISFNTLERFQETGKQIRKLQMERHHRLLRIRPTCIRRPVIPMPAMIFITYGLMSSGFSNFYVMF